jgi:hypothetical protein
LTWMVSLYRQLDCHSTTDFYFSAISAPPRCTT